MWPTSAPPTLNSEEPIYLAKLYSNRAHTLTFLGTIEHIINGAGVVDEHAGCGFSDDREPNEEPWEGIKFFLFEEEVVLNLPEAMELLRKASLRYATLHRSRVAEVMALLKKIK